MLRKDTDDIIHVAMGGGVKKVFTLSWGGVQKVLAACEGGVKKVWQQKFSIAQPPPPKYLWTLPKRAINVWK